MATFSALLAICAGNSPVTGEFPTQRTVTRSFGIFFDLRLNKRLSKQSWAWWFETPSCPLWRHCNEPRKSYKSVKNDGRENRVWSLTWQFSATSPQYSDVITSTMASQSTGVSSVCATFCTGADQRKHHHWPLWGEFTAARRITWKMFPFDDVIMMHRCWLVNSRLLRCLALEALAVVPWIFFDKNILKKYTDLLMKS